MTCPNGVTVRLTRKGRASFGTNCRFCPLQPKCTTAASGRVIVLHHHHDLLAAARPRRPPTSSTTSTGGGDPWSNGPWPVSRGSNRKLPNRSVHRNQLRWAHRCAAVNLQRLLTIGLSPTADGGWATT